MATRASSAFMYFCAFNNASAIVLGGVLCQRRHKISGLQPCFEGREMYLVIYLVHFQHSSGETCHIRPQWFLLSLSDGKQVVGSPFWTLPAHEVTNN